MFNRKSALSLALVFLSSALLHAQSLTQPDRDKGLQYLESTRQGVVNAVEGLSPAQLNFKAAPDRWSIAECLEHIAAAEDYIRGMVTDKVMKAPPRPAGEDIASLDALVLSAIPDRSHKAQAPDPLKPTNRFGSPEASLKHFQESRAVTEEFMKNTPDLREHAAMSPLGKNLDAYEFTLFIGAHSERHTKQILEVKADPKFPKM